MSSFIAYDHPDYDWKKCLDESQRMMKGHKMEYFLLNLSFIGWMIVGALCLGVGLLWVKPYITAAQTSFYQNLVGGLAAMPFNLAQSVVGIILFLALAKPARSVVERTLGEI